MKASLTKRSVGVLTDEFCFNLPDEEPKNRSVEEFVLKPSVTISRSRRTTLKELVRASSKRPQNDPVAAQASQSYNKLKHCGFKRTRYIHLPLVRPASRRVSSYRANDAIMNLPRTRHRQAFRPSVPYKLSQNLLLARLFPTIHEAR